MPPKAFGSATGPVVDLQTRIKGILRDYPPGPSLLSEFIQTAGVTALRTLFGYVAGLRFIIESQTSFTIDRLLTLHLLVF